MKIGMLFLFGALTLGSAAQAVLVDYAVPVADPAQAPYAHFKIDVQCVKTANAWVLNYAYPEELTGVPAPLSLRQSRFDQDFYFGENGEMKCADGSCAVHYNDLPFDEAALKQRLQAISKSDSEFQNRFALALINHGDPGGTFTEVPSEYCVSK